MKKSFDTVAIIHEVGNLIKDMPGFKVSISAEDDYTMIRINDKQNRETIILDLKESSGKGMILMNNLKLSVKSPFIIVMTNITNVDFKRRCYELGADYFFNKKNDAYKLSEFLHNHLYSHNNKEIHNAGIVS
jgi:DNA-binding response OmpR family regulator